MRKGRGLPWWLLARTLLLGGAGIVASLYAIDRAHERAEAKARAASAPPIERTLDAPELDERAPSHATADAPPDPMKDPR
jgi:hypothetical protein